MKRAAVHAALFIPVEICFSNSRSLQSIWNRHHIFYLYFKYKDLPLRRIMRFRNDAIFFRILGMYPSAGRTIQLITNDRMASKVSFEEHIRETI